jgi:hypothetical protein
VLIRQDISLAALDAAVGDDACTDIQRLKWFANLDKLEDYLESISSDEDDDEDVAAAVLQARKQQQRAKAAAGTSSSTPQQRWCSTAAGSPHRIRFRALTALRRVLGLSRQQPGPAGLLSNTAAVDALQELLTHADLLD